jgi:hypothetical protein
VSIAFNALIIVASVMPVAVRKASVLAVLAAPPLIKLNGNII